MGLLMAVAVPGQAWGQTPPAAAPAQHSTGEAWQLIQPPQSSLIFAADGSLIGEIGKQLRSSVTLASLPKYVPEDFLAVVDKRFYTTGSVDFKGILGALRDDVLKGEHRGGSTIPEQLAGIMHPDLIDRRDISLTRKAHELKAAADMEDHYTKDQILAAYLNWVDLGHQWFGIEAAARHYFGKPSSQLTLAEAASLAALPKTPTGYDPIRKADANKTRRNVIIDLMVEQGYVSRADGDKAKAQPLKTAPNDGFSAPSNYFVQDVRQAAESLHVPVMNGGYRIYTMLDPGLQRAAATAVVDGVRKLETDKDFKHPTMTAAIAKGNSDYLQGAAFVMDPYTGDVKALVGGRDYARGPFNRVTTAKRSPGSSFKPIVYAAAIQAGIPMNTMFPDDSNVQFYAGQRGRVRAARVRTRGRDDAPDDHARSAGGISESGCRASWRSHRNGCGHLAGGSARNHLATRFGTLSEAIGADALHPIELLSAYTAFVNSGQVVAPRFIVRIVDLNGRTVLAIPPSAPRQVLDPRVAFIVRDVMRDVALRGTGVAAREALPSSVPMAGKTGTSNRNEDAWFIGMTPDLVAGVWVGFDKQRTITPNAQGATFAAPIWGSMDGEVL